MTSKFINLFASILLVSSGKLYGQSIDQQTGIQADTLNTSKERDLIENYFQRQRNLALQLNDTLPDVKEKDQPIHEINTKIKFIILCFNLSKSYEEEINSLNKIAKEYEKHLSSIVIKADDLNKYKEIFTGREFKSLHDFITNKSESQKRSTSFPVILVLDKNGKILNAWSGDKTEDGLKKEDYYAKIKAGLENIPQQKD